METLLEVRDLLVEYVRNTGPVQVLNGITLTVHPGESVGVVGESGVGKTVLVRTILGLLPWPWRIAGGSVLYQGEDLLKRSEKQLRDIRGREIALTTHEPRKHLNPVITIGEQIANVVQAHSTASRREALERAIELTRMVGIPDPEVRQRSYPHELSGGMCQRVIIAMALAHSPKLLMADEPTAGLDVTISLQILDLMGDLVNNFNSSLLLVSRDLGVVAHYCQRVAIMYLGKIVETGRTEEIFARSLHPYSRALLSSVLYPDPAQERSQFLLKGEIPSPINLPPGCHLSPRCPWARGECTLAYPSLEELLPGRQVACFRACEENGLGPAAGAVGPQGEETVGVTNCNASEPYGSGSRP